VSDSRIPPPAVRPPPVIPSPDGEDHPPALPRYLKLGFPLARYISVAPSQKSQAYPVRPLVKDSRNGPFPRRPPEDSPPYFLRFFMPTNPLSPSGKLRSCVFFFNRPAASTSPQTPSPPFLPPTTGGRLSTSPLSPSFRARGPIPRIRVEVASKRAAPIVTGDRPPGRCSLPFCPGRELSSRGRKPTSVL